MGNHAADRRGHLEKPAATRATGTTGAADLPDTFLPEEIEAGWRLFARECQFTTAAGDVASLPPATLPEIAFAGRSNVGKSSLLNALTRRNALARTSNTPGRTQQLNFFDLDSRMILVDMPGYGYASASKAKVAAWTELVRDYLRGRPVLRRLYLLVDARRGITRGDRDIMDLLEQAAVVFQIVLTKADKVPAGKHAALIAETGKHIAKYAAGMPQVLVTSARKGAGIPKLRASLARLAEPERFR